MQACPPQGNGDSTAGDATAVFGGGQHGVKLFTFMRGVVHLDAGAQDSCRVCAGCVQDCHYVIDSYKPIWGGHFIVWRAGLQDVQANTPQTLSLSSSLFSISFFP